MILIYIEDNKLQGKVISYLDYAKTNYTTNFNDDFTTILIAQINKKTIDLINKYNNKKIIFLTYLIEDKIYLHYNSNNKKNKIIKNNFNNIFNKCYRVITSQECIKKIIEKNIKRNIVVINKELPIINISNANKDIYIKYNIDKRHKKILIIDLNYKYLNDLYKISYLYPKYNFIYIGFKPNYLLKNKDIEILYSLPNNVTLIKYLDLNIYSDLCKISYLIINYENINLDIKYLYLTLLFRKQMIIKNSDYYESFLLDNKNTYIFNNTDELLLRIKKIINERISNLSEEGYELIKNNTFENTAKKFNMYLN